MSNKIQAFTLRKKTSKAGKIYYISPFGQVDLLAFVLDNGDIEVSYTERSPQATGYAPRVAPQAQSPRAVITPRQGPPKIIPRDAPHHRPQPQGFVDHTAQAFDSAPMPDIDDCPF